MQVPLMMHTSWTHRSARLPTQRSVRQMIHTHPTTCMHMALVCRHTHTVCNNSGYIISQRLLPQHPATTPCFTKPAVRLFSRFSSSPQLPRVNQGTLPRFLLCAAAVVGPHRRLHVLDQVLPAWLASLLGTAWAPAQPVSATAPLCVSANLTAD
jgi:hypothetical protein